MADPKFHQLHYNFIAKRLRSNYPIYDRSTDAGLIDMTGARRVIEDIALECAHRFKADDPDFDHLKFLDQCSPNPDIYPFSELWEEA